MSKKLKKKILKKIEERLEKNRYFCVYNNCTPSEYMEGVNDFAKDLKKFIFLVKENTEVFSFCDEFEIISVKKV